MLAIVIMMLVIVAVAALVLVYVAYPHRGEDVPRAPWLGQALERAVESAPVIDDDAQEPQRSEVRPGQRLLG